MIRRNGVWFGAGVLGLLSAVSAQGCGSDVGHSTEKDGVSGPRALGELALGLILPDGSEVSSVNYVITKDGVEVRTGVLLVGSDGRASGTITELEPGTGYRVVLNAPRDAGSACVGEGTFTVFAGQTSTVDVVLQCDTVTAEGNLTINGAFNVCPKMTSSSISPVILPVGSSTSITASAIDRDMDPLTFLWSAPSGTFSAPNALATSYTCTSVGVQTLTLSITDGPSRGCTKTGTLTVTCVASGIDAGTDAGSDAGVVDSGSDAGLADAGVGSSSTAYLLPSQSGVLINALLSAGDSPNLKPDGVNPYRMVGIPDGLGAFDNGDGTFTLLANHELGAGGIARAHGGNQAFVSKWQIRAADQRVLHGEDLIQQVQLWSTATSTYTPTPNVVFSRFCSADLAKPSAFYHAASSTGFQGRLFLNGEEGGAGRAFAHGLDGVTWELPRLGKQGWENAVASPASGLKTVVVGLDDTSPAGQVFVYVGTKTNTGNSVERAGLTNGALYGVAVTGVTAETNAAIIPTGPFTLASLGNVAALTAAQLETAATTAAVTTFQRPEDGAWDPSNPNDFYFVSTASATTNSRLWRLRFSDATQPELGGTIEAMLAGNEGHRMLDNLTIDPRGHILATEDVGGNERLGKIWRYTIATDAMVEIAAHDAARFTTGAPGFLTNDEEASGIIDATELLGAGWFLFDDQAHYTIAGEVAEGGQLLSIYDPGSL